MNICIKDIYLIILSLIVLYLFYSRIYEEKFQNTSTGYQADVEAIRNLSSIATQLTTSNKLTMPGALTVTNDLSVGGDAYIGKDKNFILDGDNKWIFHTPDDGRKILYLAPWNGKDNWDWSKQFTIDNNGNVSSAGELSVKTLDGGKQVKIGSSQIKFRGDGIVHYGLTNDKDGKFKISNLSGTGDIGSGWVNDCLTLDPTGNSTFNGSLVVNRNLVVNGGINTVNGLATTAYGTGWSSIFYKLPTNFSGFFQVFVQGINTGYPSNDQGNKYLFATGFWVPNITSPIAPKQDTNVNNWTLKVDTENNGGTGGNPVIYLKSSSGGDRIWYSVITYPTPNHEGK